MAAPFSVIIPAHNEENVIERCLRPIVDGAPQDAQPEIIVAANGCTDRTVDIALKYLPPTHVLDLPSGSKVAAMNCAAEIAEASPCFFLDADVQCSYASLLATAEVLSRPGVMAASPKLEINLTGCDSWVRSYYRVWLTQPYVQNRLVGSGIFGLSSEGLEVIGTIPPTFADDTWVRTRFAYEQRRNVEHDDEGNPVSFTVTPPRNFRDLVRIEARRRVGSEQVLKLYPSPHNQKINRPADLKDAFAAGASMRDVLVYLGLKTAALVLYRWDRLQGRTPVWVRDVKARETI